MSIQSTPSTPSHETHESRTRVQRAGRRSGMLRIGIVIAALLGVLDVAAGAMQLGGSAALLPAGVAVAMIVLGAGTVVLVPFAWRGARWAGWTIAAMRIASALTGLPAFFVAGVPAGAVIAAAVGIFFALVVTALIGLGLEGRR